MKSQILSEIEEMEEFVYSNNSFCNFVRKLKQVLQFFGLQSLCDDAITLLQNSQEITNFEPKPCRQSKSFVFVKTAMDPCVLEGEVTVKRLFASRHKTQKGQFYNFALFILFLIIFQKPLETFQNASDETINKTYHSFYYV